MKDMYIKHMLFPVVYFAVVFLGMGSVYGSISWETSYQKALEKSQRENKPLFLFFTGSDWSGTAMKMKNEVLDSEPFQKMVGSDFICMEVDFPQHTTLSREKLEQNNFLQERFQVKEWPLILLIDGSEREIIRLGYLSENGPQLAQDLLRIITQDRSLASGLENLGDDSTELKKLYQIALELGRGGAMEKIIQAGSMTKDSFFSLEKYRLLVELGKMNTEEAQAIRTELLSLASSEVHFTLALIEFQELAKLPKNSIDPQKAIRPLEDYLLRFAHCDQENIWRIEMMIAQYYLDADEWITALKHAEIAYKAAPIQMRPEIEHSLEYIRQQASQLTQN